MKYKEDLPALRDWLETHQVKIYFAAVVAAGVLAGFVPAARVPEALITPALALMLFVTFLQVPLSGLWQALTRIRFLMALLTANFVAIPLLVAVLVLFLPPDPMIRLGVLLVLLTPCIDYVVTFSHLGRADARGLLAATPVLLIVQMVALPLYLSLFMGAQAADLVHIGPFLEAFVWLIMVPLGLAALMQVRAQRIVAKLSLLPVPATALVLFVVIAAVAPQLEPVLQAALSVVPVYIAFAVLAPFAGWGVARLFRLEAPAGRAVAFSAATRNSLVVLPLALAVPGALPLLPAIIVTQTLIELASELVYMRLMPRLGRD